MVRGNEHHGGWQRPKQEGVRKRLTQGFRLVPGESWEVLKAVGLCSGLEVVRLQWVTLFWGIFINSILRQKE